MLVPPVSFGLVEEGIYRCSKVETLNLSFLETLNLRIIIFLSGEEPSRYFKDFFKRSSIEWIAINPNSYTTLTSSGIRNSNNQLEIEKNGTSPEKQANQNSDDTDAIHNSKTLTSSIANDYSSGAESNGLLLLNAIVLQKIFSVLLDQSNFNCLLVDKSAIVVGVLRKILKWNISSIVNEYRLFAGKNRNYFSESFLELVKVNVQQKVEQPQQNDALLSSCSHLTSQSFNGSKTFTGGGKNYKMDTIKPNNVPDFQHKLRPRSGSIVVENDDVIIKEKENGLAGHHIEFHQHPSFGSNTRGQQNLTNNLYQKILTEHDLETFEPEVPGLLLAMIEDVEKIQEQEESMRKEKSKIGDSDIKDDYQSTKLSSYALQNSPMKKSASALGIFGNTYRLAFGKTQQADYEYYKCNAEKKLEEQNEKIKHATLVSNSVLKIDKHSKSKVPSRKNIVEPLTKEKTTNKPIKSIIPLTIKPNVYTDEEQSQKNIKLLNKYGANINENPFLVTSSGNADSDALVLQKTNHNNKNIDSEATKASKILDPPKNIVNLIIPVEENLPEWFKLQRDIWEKNNTVDFHTESVFV
ncbi:hypothetical protein ACO0QE_000854 [Hanseniaspora vineae]